MSGKRKIKLARKGIGESKKKRMRGQSEKGRRDKVGKKETRKDSKGEEK